MSITEECFKISKEFSEADLKPHPTTSEVMSFFDKDATFESINGYYASKSIARIGFKVLCEWSTVDIQRVWDVTFEDKGDHILWSFKSIQLRKGLLPTWLKSPRRYRIDFSAKLYFVTSSTSTQISRFEIVQNDWNLIEE